MDTRAIDHKERERKLDALKCCGANRGRHYYEPIEWYRDEKIEMVRTLMCMVCFQRVSLKTLYETFEEAKI